MKFEQGMTALSQEDDDSAKHEKFLMDEGALGNSRKKEYFDQFFDSDAEGELEILLETLDPAFQETWSEKIWSQIADEGLSPQDACNQVRVFIEKRQEALNDMKLDIGGETDESVIESKRAYLQKMYNATVSMPLGEGRVAKVFDFFGVDGDLCVKQLKDPEAYARDARDTHREDNTLYQEALFLEELQDFEVEGVRSPKLLEKPNNEFLVMERLDAVDMDHVIRGRCEIPTSFDHDAFFIKLRSYIDQLHQKGYYHGDLYPRNVMIDRKTGNPRIIDFGKAKRHMDVDVNKESILESRDYAGIEEMVTKMRKHRLLTDNENHDKMN